MNRCYKTVYAIVWFLLKLFFPWEAEGRENIPDEGGVMLCANHTSFLDPLLVICAAAKKRQIHVIAKEELFRIPLLGFILRKIEMIPVKRGKSDITAFKESLRVLRDKGVLLIFPEGTRVKEGVHVEAHTGAVVMAARTNVPIIPVYIGVKKRIFCKTKVIFGAPASLEISGRKPTPEESQQLTCGVMNRIHALGETQ